MPFTPRTSEYSPHTEYGRTKAEAEQQLRTLGERVTIVRFSQVWAKHRELFQAWRRSLIAGQGIRPLEDMTFAPVPLALAIDTLCRLRDGALVPIIQLSARADISYAAVAYHMADNLRVDASLIQPLASTALDREIEHVPRHTTLEVADPESALGLQAPDPWQAIEDALAP
jgi:dTDP-4-dehydrorhamnose reductase